MAVTAHASLVEYFREQVEGALTGQRIPAAGETAHYVVRLLADVARSDGPAAAAAFLDPRPLAIRLADALDERCPDPARALRGVADAALLLGGFFASRAGARGVPPAYYRRVGGFAYGTLGQEPQVLAATFKDLAARFAQYADALGEVALRAEMQSSSGLIRAFEAWERSPDRRTERLLVERGVVLDRGQCGRLQ